MPCTQLASDSASNTGVEVTHARSLLLADCRRAVQMQQEKCECMNYNSILMPSPSFANGRQAKSAPKASCSCNKLERGMHIAQQTYNMAVCHKLQGFTCGASRCACVQAAAT